MRISDWSSDVCSSDLLAAQPRHLALADAIQAHGAHQIVDRAGGDALDVGFLDDRGQRLLGQAPGLQEGREVAPLAQLGNPQLDRAGTGLPVPVAVAVALVAPLGAALAMRSEEHTSELQSLMRISYAV